MIYNLFIIFSNVQMLFFQQFHEVNTLYFVFGSFIAAVKRKLVFEDEILRRKTSAQRKVNYTTKSKSVLKKPRKRSISPSGIPVGNWSASPENNLALRRTRSGKTTAVVGRKPNTRSILHRTRSVSAERDSVSQKKMKCVVSRKNSVPPRTRSVTARERQTFTAPSRSMVMARKRSVTPKNKKVLVRKRSASPKNKKCLSNAQTTTKKRHVSRNDFTL